MSGQARRRWSAVNRVKPKTLALAAIKRSAGSSCARRIERLASATSIVIGVSVTGLSDNAPRIQRGRSPLSSRRPRFASSSVSQMLMADRWRETESEASRSRAFGESLRESSKLQSQTCVSRSRGVTIRSLVRCAGAGLKRFPLFRSGDGLDQVPDDRAPAAHCPQPGFRGRPGWRHDLGYRLAEAGHQNRIARLLHARQNGEACRLEFGYLDLFHAANHIMVKDYGPNQTVQPFTEPESGP